MKKPTASDVDKRRAASAERQRRRRAGAAGSVGPVYLDAAHADALARVLASTGEHAAAWVRRMIIEHDPGRRRGRVGRSSDE